MWGVGESAGLTLASTPIISPKPKKLRLRTSFGRAMLRRRGMLERKSQCSWIVVPSLMAYKLCRRDAGGESARMRGVGPGALRATAVVAVVLLEGPRGI